MLRDKAVTTTTTTPPTRTTTTAAPTSSGSGVVEGSGGAGDGNGASAGASDGGRLGRQPDAVGPVEHGWIAVTRSGKVRTAPPECAPRGPLHAGVARPSIYIYIYIC